MHDHHYRVGRSDVSDGVCAERGKHVVARGQQVLSGELGWRCVDCSKFLRPVVKLQLFPIGEFAGIDGDWDIRPRIHRRRPGAARARRADRQRVVMGGVGPVNKSDVLIL